MDVTCWRGDGGERKMKKAVCFIGGVGGVEVIVCAELGML